MKIVFIITRADDLGGAQVHVRDLAAVLKGRGEDVLVLAGGGGILFAELDARGVSCRRLERLVHPIKPWRDWAGFKEIRAALQELKPDLVTTHSNKAGLLGRLAARSLNIPSIYTSHGFLFGGRENSLAGRFYRLVESAAARASERVIAVSASEFQLASRLGVIPADKMTVIHNGLPDLDPAFRADPAAKPVKITMVARFAEPKDHLTLFKALGGLLNRAWSLQLVGEGAGQRRAEQGVQELGLAERVQFLGARPDVPAILAAGQVLVLSSWREGFPLSVLEAMRAGLPVVAAAVGGVAEAVVDGETGFLFPAGDGPVLRDRLARLIDQPRLRKAMGEAGRARFEEHFTLDRMVDKTEAVYRQLLRRGEEEEA